MVRLIASDLKESDGCHADERTDPRFCRDSGVFVMRPPLLAARRETSDGEALLAGYLDPALTEQLATSGAFAEARALAGTEQFAANDRGWPAYLGNGAGEAQDAPAGERRDPAPEAATVPAYLRRPAPVPAEPARARAEPAAPRPAAPASPAPAARAAPLPAAAPPASTRPAPLPAVAPPASATPAPAATPASPPPIAATAPDSAATPTPAPAQPAADGAAAPAAENTQAADEAVDAAAEAAASVDEGVGPAAAAAGGGGGGGAPAMAAGGGDGGGVAPPAPASMRLVGDPASPPEVIELAMTAAELRARGEALQQDSETHAGNAAALRGNVGTMRESMAGAAGAVETAQGHLDYRRELVGTSRQALAASRAKAAEVAAGAPGGVTTASENKARSGPMASESGDLSRQNSETNTSDDPETQAKAREQGGKFDKVGNDSATIDSAVGEAQTAATTLVADAATATQSNDEAETGMTAVEATLDSTGTRIAEMQGQGAAAQASLEGMANQPAQVEGEAGAIGATGQTLADSATGIEQRLETIQQDHAARTAQADAEAQAAAAAEADAPTAGDEALPVEALPFADAAMMPDALAGEEDGAVPLGTTTEADVAPAEMGPEPVGADGGGGDAALAPDPAEERRQADLALIAEELHGREFSSLTAGERRSIALRTMVRGAFSGMGEISWPSPGGVARGLGHLAVGLIDPRGALAGVASGFGMIVNAGSAFGRDPSWSGALRLAANVATGLAVILGSITMLAGVIAALATAITIVTLGVAAPITGPIIAFCATVMSVVGGWTFWVGLIAAGLQALMFLVDLYKAGTAQTAEELQGHTAHMRDDAANAGNSLLQAGMGRLAQVGGSSLQGSIRAAGGGVRFAAQTGARFGATGSRALATVRAAGSRGLGAIRSAGARGIASGIRSGAGRLGTRALTGARSLGTRAVEGARALPGRIATGATDVAAGARALPGRIATGARTAATDLAAGARALPGRIATGARALPGRIATGARSAASGARALPGRVAGSVREGVRDLRRGLSRDYAIGTDIAAGEIGAAARTARIGAYIDDLLTHGPLPGRVSPTAVAEAQASLRAGTATAAEHRTLIQKALEDARDFNSASAGGRPLSWDVCKGRCGPGRDVSATSFGELAAESPVPIGLRRFQAEEVFGINKHGFNVVTIPGEPPVRYLVDPTFSQFMRPTGSMLDGATAEVLRSSPEGAAMARALLRDGYIPLTEESAALYARALGSGRAGAPGLGRRLLEPGPGHAVSDEVIGGGAGAVRGGARRGPIMRETGEADILDAAESLTMTRDLIRDMAALPNADPARLAALRDLERRLVELHRRRGVPLPAND